LCPRTGNNCPQSCSDDDYDDADAGGVDNGEEDFVHVNMYGEEIIQTSRLSPVHINFADAQWIKVTKMDEVFDIFDKIGYVQYVLVGGNTAHGKTAIAKVDIAHVIHTGYFIFTGNNLQDVP
jgi:hypothetical protein